jgi:hypothetical protein
MTPHAKRISYLLAFVALTGLAAGDLSAQRGGGSRGGGGGRSASASHHKGTHHASGGAHRSVSTQHAANRSNVNRNVNSNHRNVNTANVNRNVNNVNRNVNVNNVNVHGHGGYGYGHGYGYGAHPVARGAVAGVTAAAVMGSYYNTLPSGCATVNRGGLIYHHCGSTWYQDSGGQYLVVTAP